MVYLKKLLLAALLSAFALPLAAQEPWDVHFKLTAGAISGAESNSLGQNKVYGLGIGGVYPLTLSGFGVIEAGYKWLPTLSVTTGSTRVEDYSDFYFVGGQYRHEIWRNGVYVQGGLRAVNTRTVRNVIGIGLGVGGGNSKARSKGVRGTHVGWSLGAGFRLTDLWSVEVGLSNASLSNVAGASVGGTIAEFALCIHR